MLLFIIIISIILYYVYVLYTKKYNKTIINKTVSLKKKEDIKQYINSII